MERKSDDRLARRRAAIVAAARSLFLERGFEQTTLADIVSKSGGSLSTIYKEFGTKERLLRAVIDFDREPGMGIAAYLARTDMTRAQIIREFARDLRENRMTPDHLAITRIVIGHSARDQEFAREFNENNFARAHEALSHMFAVWGEEGVALTAPPGVLATALMSVFAFEMHRAAIGHVVPQVEPGGSLDQQLEFFIRSAGLAEDLLAEDLAADDPG